MLLSTVHFTLLISFTPHTESLIPKITEDLADVQDTDTQEAKDQYMLCRDSGKSQHIWRPVTLQ